MICWSSIFRSFWSLKKIDRDCISLVDLCKRSKRLNSSQKVSDSLEKMYFLCVFDSFPPLYAKRSNHSGRSSLFNLFLRSTGLICSRRLTVIESIPLIFEKDWPWSNRSCQSLKKIDREQINIVDLYKRLTGAIRFDQIDLSITKNKQFEQKSDW